MFLTHDLIKLLYDINKMIYNIVWFEYFDEVPSNTILTYTYTMFHHLFVISSTQPLRLACFDII